MQAFPDHLDRLEAGESADDIGQEAAGFPLVLFLGAVARNAAAAGRSGWPASDRSDPTPPRWHRALEMLHDGLVVPADDDGATATDPHEADLFRVTRGLALPILEGRHRSILWCHGSVEDPLPAGDVAMVSIGLGLEGVPIEWRAVPGRAINGGPSA